MKVSLKEIERLGYGEIVTGSVDTLVAKIGSQLGEVEDVEDVGAKYAGVVVAEVVSVDDHPDADRLHVCLIDDGGAVKGVERTDKGLVQVVCGAPNVRSGLMVAWLPPGATVPETYHRDPFVLDARKLRGVMSNGMLASPKELALGDSHDGILEIDADTKPGQSFASAYHLDDHVVEIENKMFTHRPDCFGLLGVAREIAGIQGKAFTSPEWYLDDGGFTAGEGLELSVDNQLPDLVPRFMALALEQVTVAASPAWLQSFLVRNGQKSINNVVDITNYLMLLTGQPLHAYDYDKVAQLTKKDGAVLGVRHPKKEEKLALLNGKTITPRDKAILITTDQVAIGMGGVMGGADTEVDETTRNIILEVATFDMYSIRRTSMAHGLFTDAVTRFNKGQSPLQNDRIMTKAVALLAEVTGARPASHVIDHTNALKPFPPVKATARFINERLGLDLSVDDMSRLLANVEFSVEVKGDELKVTPPFWRTDISIAEDIVEEIGRLYGYDNLPLELPLRSVEPAAINESFDIKRRVRHSLARAGANEVLSYSFVHERLLRNARQDPTEAFKLSNALSPDLQYFRLSLMPSLLDLVHPNVKSGYPEFALFEIGKFHNAASHDSDSDGLPKEFTTVDLVYAATAKAGKQGAAYYQVKRLLDQLAVDLGASVEVRPLDDTLDTALSAPYAPDRSGAIYAGDLLLGIIGEFKPEVSRAFKLPAYAAGMSLDMEGLRTVAGLSVSTYRPLSRFPSVTQDVTLRLTTSTSYSAVYDRFIVAFNDAKTEDLDYQLEATTLYQAENDAAHKNLTLRLTVTSDERTLSDSEVSSVLQAAATQVAADLKAQII